MTSTAIDRNVGAILVEVMQALRTQLAVSWRNPA